MLRGGFWILKCPVWAWLRRGDDARCPVAFWSLQTSPRKLPRSGVLRQASKGWQLPNARRRHALGLAAAQLHRRGTEMRALGASGRGCRPTGKHKGPADSRAAEAGFQTGLMRRIEMSWTVL